MILSKVNNRHLRSLLIITMLAIMASTVTACLDIEPPAPPETGGEKTQNTAVTAPRLPVRTEESAVLAVYQHLLGQAASHKAKGYLADFYTASDNWSAAQETFKDGSTLWHVTLDMTEVKVWTEKPYWQQASWLVLRDGEVIPSNRFQANALRIEADLQELSPPPAP